MRPDSTVANGSASAINPKSLQIVTQFDRRIYIALAQYQHDMGQPFIQDAVRILVAQALSNLGYPKEVHPIKMSTIVDKKKKK